MSFFNIILVFPCMASHDSQVWKKIIIMTIIIIIKTIVIPQKYNFLFKGLKLLNFDLIFGLLT